MYLCRLLHALFYAFFYRSVLPLTDGMMMSERALAVAPKLLECDSAAGRAYPGLSASTGSNGDHDSRTIHTTASTEARREARRTADMYYSSSIS